MEHKYRSRGVSFVRKDVVEDAQEQAEVDGCGSLRIRIRAGTEVEVESDSP